MNKKLRYTRKQVLYALLGILVLVMIVINISREISFPERRSDDDITVTITDDEEYEYEDMTTTNGMYVRSLNTPPLQLSAQSYLVADYSTGQVLFEKNSRSIYPIASITKLMTAVVAEERLPAEHTATVSTRAQQTGGGLRGGLTTNQQITVRELLFPLLMTSSNNGSEVIAETFGRNFFMEQMNKKAQELGMWDTFFDDPSGLSADNVSTAEDLFLLMKYIFPNHHDLLKMSRLSFYSGKNQTWRNISSLIREPSFVGGKTGFTNAARQTSAGIYRAPLSNDTDRLIVIIILQSENRAGDIRAIVQYLERYVQYRDGGER